MQLRVLAAEYGMIEYEASAEANLAWVSWRRGDPDKAIERGERSLALWRQWPSPAPYPFQWFARWPLLALAVHQSDAEAAAKHARELLDPSQQPPPAELEAPLRMLVTDAEGAEGARWLSVGSGAIGIAERLGYL